MERRISLQDRLLLFDGAMGTYYAERYSAGSRQCELANLSAPEAVLAIHRAYIDAGAGAIRTNTFGANTALLESSFDTVARVSEAGWRLALDAAAGRAEVWADIGPIPAGSTTDPDGETAAITELFLSLGARRFVFETFGEAESVARAALHIKARFPDATVLAQFAVSPDGFTRLGIPGADIMRAMEGCDAVNGWGFNCVSGPSYLLHYMAGLKRSAKRLSAMPNAGYPAISGGRTVYTNNPDYFAQKLAEFRALGITILGGCCGTTPEHIRAAARLLTGTETAAPPHAHLGHRQETTPAAENRFWSILKAGRKAIAAEVDPPRDANSRRMAEGAQRLAQAGADAITVADNPLARARADSSMMASWLRRRCGCEVLPHIACRDRNLNAIKSLLLGLHIEGVRNVLVVTGDPIAQADRGEIKGVYNLNATVLAGYIRSLNEELFPASPFAVGAALNVNAPNFDAELRRAEQKTRQGVQFFLTQPVFAKAAAENLRRAGAALDAKLLAGILPLASLKNALFLNNEVPGMAIPDAVLESLRGLEREEGEKQGLRLALDTARELLPHTHGFYVMTPLNRFRLAGELVQALRREIDGQNRREAQ